MDCHKFIWPGTGDRDLLDDGTWLSAWSPHFALLSRTNRWVMRCGGLHARTSYKWNASVSNSPSEFPARASQSVESATVPLSPVCCCQVSCDVKQIRSVCKAQEIKQKLVCHSYSSTITWPQQNSFSKKGFTQHSFPGQATLCSSVSDGILKRWPPAFDHPVKKQTSHAGDPVDCVAGRGRWCDGLHYPDEWSHICRCLDGGKGCWLMPTIYKCQQQLTPDFSTWKRI